MKSVLISIQPRHCEEIASGKKTVEVRKTAPKIPTPFKCYIYQTKVMADNTKYGFKTWARCGKVIGEFVCDKIGQIRFDDDGDLLYEPCLAGSSPCLSLGKLQSYIGVNNVGYGWHISDLKIYDKPKELSEFTTLFCPYEVTKCKVGARLCKHYTFKDALGGLCDYRKQITRPPQSWMYVEEI